MNSEETREWLNYHGTLFGDFRSWVSSLSPDERADLADASQVALRKIDLSEARRVSGQILAGKIRRPFVCSDVVAIVAEFAAPPVDRQWRPPPPEGEPLTEPISPLLRELLREVGRPEEVEEPAEPLPQSRASSRKAKCPYCEGAAIVVSEVAHCLDCSVRFDPEGGGQLSFEEACVARSAGESVRNRRKHLLTEKRTRK